MRVFQSSSVCVRNCNRPPEQNESRTFDAPYVRFGSIMNTQTGPRYLGGKHILPLTWNHAVSDWDIAARDGKFGRGESSNQSDAEHTVRHSSILLHLRLGTLFVTHHRRASLLTFPAIDQRETRLCLSADTPNHHTP